MAGRAMKKGLLPEAVGGRVGRTERTLLAVVVQIVI